MKVLITGYTGFIGVSLVKLLLAAGYKVNLAGRTPGPERSESCRYFATGNIGPLTEWRRALDGCEAVVHLAGQVPIQGASDELMREVNDLGTARLLEQASVSGARLFILLSSTSVVADHSSDIVVDELRPPAPLSPYGRSKLAAESHLSQFSGSGRCGIALRPPLVYGSAARGNWRLLQRLAASGAPLPFGAVHNRRTLISVENLVDAILRVISLPHDPVRTGVYMVSDHESVSLTEILTWLRSGMGLRPRLFSVPPALLETVLKVLNKKAMARALLGNLEVDSSLFRRTFDWPPKISAPDAITGSGAGFVTLAQRRRG